MQSNFWAGSKYLDQHKIFWGLLKDKALQPNVPGTGIHSHHNKLSVHKTKLLEIFKIIHDHHRII